MIAVNDRLVFPDNLRESAEELEYDHCMDISGSVFTRMNELGMTQCDLAAATGMNPAQISRIIKGKQNLTIKTIARLEEALDFRLDEGFRYHAALQPVTHGNVINFNEQQRMRRAQTDAWQNACPATTEMQVN